MKDANKNYQTLLTSCTTNKQTNKQTVLAEPLTADDGTSGFPEAQTIPRPTPIVYSAAMTVWHRDMVFSLTLIPEHISMQATCNSFRET
jgi:hypothetical protein